ncbi:MAG: Re/Si-specific NAD(P)(+) transhydrogenase subunit alpha [Kiritimatiellae bacterium]|nr:Re/Si-specific NAD(P)(+) transhydrogenase subunit alpha [Kiritimatiellia bacterium]
MNLFIPRETDPSEQRTPLTPSTAERLVKLGAVVEVEAGLGATLRHTDEAFSNAGATVVTDRCAALGRAKLVLRLHKPPRDEVAAMKPGTIHISHLDPFNETELIQDLASAGISALSMELIPRTTIAQKMDALSSQANLAGYVAVILAAARLNKILPMMMTPSGTLTPSRVFVIGAGVAGLQAIATAKRLGARVEAFDTRPVVEEQVLSLGARFVKVELGETGQTKDGYAQELTEEQLQKQRDAMAKACAQADIVITTAQLFGRKAPVIVTREIIAAMKPGSVIVDMAVESGGNVEGSRLNEDVDINGVAVLGFGNLPGRVPEHASQMYANNLVNLVDHFWDKESKTFPLKLDDEIIQGCLVTHDGVIVHPAIRKKLNLDAEAQ